MNFKKIAFIAAFIIIGAIALLMLVGTMASFGYILGNQSVAGAIQILAACILLGFIFSGLVKLYCHFNSKEN